MNKSFYFPHDYNSANDHKILFLRQQLGIEGYGIFWYIVEQLAQSGGRLPLKIIPVISMQIQTTADKVTAVIRNYELFVIEEDTFFSSRLMAHLEIRAEASNYGKLGADKRWGNDHKNRVAIGPPNGPPNAKERKGKEIKEIKERRVPTFSEFDSAIDSMYREQLTMTHRGKDIDKAVKEAFAYLITDETRAKNSDSGDFKRLVNTWLGNMKGEKTNPNPYKLH